jgi:uncharacterized membrane protein YgdD (TMEM256/DUF423 family)
MWLGIAAISGFVAVAAGAFGAHGLRGRITAEMLVVFETAVRYQFYHALALLAVWRVAQGSNSLAVPLSGWSFVLGTLLFSGSLYALALTGVRGLGMVTPFGGAAFLVGWAALAWIGFRAVQT